MGQDSPTKRRIRKLKRERTLAYKMVEIALKQRDQARFIAGSLNEELRKLTAPKEDSVAIKVIEEAPAQPEEASAE